MSFRELLEGSSKIFKDKDTTKWSTDEDALKAGKSAGLILVGVGLLKKFESSDGIHEFLFWLPSKAEFQNFNDFNKENKNRNEVLVKYNSRTLSANKEFHTCILNPSKGYMRFMNNINVDPDLEDAEWSKPYYFSYLRVTPSLN